MPAVTCDEDYAPFNDVPDYWLVDPVEIAERLEEVKRGEVVSVGRSGGGRVLPGVVFAPAEWERTMVVIGRTHGIEMQGTATCMSLIQLLETGRVNLGANGRRLAEQKGGTYPLFNPPEGGCRALLWWRCRGRALAGAGLCSRAVVVFGRRSAFGLAPPVVPVDTGRPA